MKRLVTTALLAGTIAMLPHPTPADARSVVKQCVEEAIESCDEDFPGNWPHQVAIRGWCYMIRTAMCEVFDPELR